MEISDSWSNISNRPRRYYEALGLEIGLGYDPTVW